MVDCAKFGNLVELVDGKKFVTLKLTSGTAIKVQKDFFSKYANAGTDAYPTYLITTETSKILVSALDIETVEFKS